MPRNWDPSSLLQKPASRSAQVKIYPRTKEQTQHWQPSKATYQVTTKTPSVWIYGRFLNLLWWIEEIPVAKSNLIRITTFFLLHCQLLYEKLHLLKLSQFQNVCWLSLPGRRLKDPLCWQMLSCKIVWNLNDLYFLWTAV